jgi:chemosensory pili system protein ChpA (sensor histidine kinase/response regulator)
MTAARKGFDTGPLSWVKSEIDLALQRAIAALQAASVKEASTSLHQASGALQIVGLDGITQVMAELEGLLADMLKGAVPDDEPQRGVASRGIAGIAGYLDQLMTGVEHQPLRLLPLYRELVAARDPARAVDPVDLYFPDLAPRPPRRDKVPVQLHAEEAGRYLRDQRARFQRGFVAWLKQVAKGEPDSASVAEMRAAVDAIEATMGPASPRAFWWTAAAYFEALAGGMLPGDLDARRMCNRIESQIRRLAEGSQNVAERLLRETLFHVAHAQPGSDLVRQVQETFRLASTLPGQAASSLAAPPAAVKQMREHLALALAAWNRFATGHPAALAEFNKAAAPLAAGAKPLGNEALSRLVARIAEVGEWAARDSAAMSEAVSLEQAVALLLAQRAIESLSDGELAPDDAGFRERSERVCDRLATGMQGTLLRTGSGDAMLDELAEQAQERLMVNQVVGEMQESLRAVESVLDEFFRDPSRRSRLATLDRPLMQLTGAFDVLGDRRARAMLEATAAEVARVGDPAYSPKQAEFEAIAQTLSGLGFYIAAIANGDADFDAIMKPVLAKDLPPGEETEVTVEAQLASLQQKAAALFEQWKQRPEDARIKAQLQQELGAIQQDAGLVANAALEEKAAQALKLIESASAPVAPELAAAVQGIAPVAAAEAALSEEAARLLEASAESVDAELLSVYLEEAGEVLGAVAENLALLRERPRDAAVLTGVRRGFHTLKGSGRMVGLMRLGETAWSMEQTLNRWLQEERPATPALMALIDEGHRYFTAAVASLKAGAAAPDDTALRTQAEAVRNGASESSGEAAGVAVQVPAEDKAALDAPAEQPSPASVLDRKALRAAAAAASAVSASPAAAANESVMLGDREVSATLFTLFSGEAHSLLTTIREEFETLKQHGIISDAMLRATHTLAGICGTVGLAELRRVAKAFEAALTRLGTDALSTDEEDLVGFTIDALDAMITSAVNLRVQAADESLLDRLEHVAAGNMAAPHEEDSSPPADDAEDSAAGPSTERRQQRLEDELDPQLVQVFVEEAGELIPAIGSALRGWRAAPPEADQGRALQRLLHTFKGGARMAGAMGLGELTHSMETRVEAALAGGEPAAAFFDDLESSFDRVGVLFDRLAGRDEAASPGAPAAEGASTADAADAGLQLARDGEAARALLRVRADVVDRLVNEAGEVSIARSRIEGELRTLKAALQELTDNVLRLRTQLREVEIQAESQMQSRTADTRGKDGFDPLEFDRFTRFQELTRLMAESVNDVQTVQQTLLAAAGSSEAALAAQARLSRDLQQNLMRVRMVPFSSLSERLHRIVRQTAREVGKRANLDIRGGNIEIDRSVLERITGPFEHLVRNAVGHGIEAPEVRAAAGKPAMGDVRIEATQEGNEVRLTISDDGGGLDLARIRAKAQDLGLLKPGDAPSDAEVADFIFQPGLTTAKALTEVSGRGIGMDVVRTETAALGGRVEVHSTPGAGARFTIVLPVTLAVMQAVLVRGGERSFAVPAAMVEHVAQLRPEEIEQAVREGAVTWQSRRLALHYLPRLVEMRGVQPDLRHTTPVMFLKSGSHAIALFVDEIVSSNQEIVVKQLGPQLQRLPGIAAATVLPNGDIALIVNPVQLSQRAAAQPAGQPAAPAPATEAAALPVVMVVDDSLTVRKFTGRLLERHGYAMMVARDGVEALEKLEEALPDVMLVDIEMPRMDGFELARRVRADARLAHIPIVVISSRTADKHREHATEIGVNAFLGKPYPEEELLELIGAFTGKTA